MEIKKGKTLKGKIIAAATAISLFTGVTVSSTFDSASDIMMSDIKEPTPIVEVVDLKKAEAPPVVEKIAEEEEKRLTLKQRLAQKIMALPAGVRAVVVVPLYALGALVSRTAGAAFSAVLSPVLGAVHNWVIMAVVIMAIVTIGAKAMFPDIPLKEILRPRNFLYVLLGVAVIFLINKAAPLIGSDFQKWTQAVTFALGLVLVIIVTVPAAVSIHRRRSAKKNQGAETPA